MNNAFLQFELDSALREIITFITYEGLRRLKRLSFAHKIFWNRNIIKENGRNYWKLPNCVATADYAILFVTSFDTIVV